MPQINVQDLAANLGYGSPTQPRFGGGQMQYIPDDELMAMFGYGSGGAGSGTAARSGGGGGGGGGGYDPMTQVRYDRDVFQQDRSFQFQQQQYYDSLELDRQSLQESIANRQQRLQEVIYAQDAATGRQREQLAAERQRLEAQLQFDREQLGENRRQFDANFGENQRQYNQTFGEDQRQFNQTFGEGQRQFDTRTGMDYLQMAANTPDTVRQSMMLLGDTGGRTPFEGAMQMFRPVTRRPEEPLPVNPPQAATGAIYTKPSRPLIAEGGEPEVVMPLSRMLPGTTMPPINPSLPIGPKPLTGPIDYPVAPRQPISIPATLDPSYTDPRQGDGRQPMTIPTTPDPRYTDPVRPEAPYDATYWQGELRAAIAAYRANPSDQAANQRVRLAISKQVQNRQPSQADQQERDRIAAQRAFSEMLARVFFGGPVSRSGPLPQTPVQLNPNATEQVLAAQGYGIGSIAGIPLPGPEEMAYRYTQLPQANRDVMMSAYDYRMPGGQQEAWNRMQAVTPQGMAARRFGYGG